MVKTGLGRRQCRKRHTLGGCSLLNTEILGGDLVSNTIDLLFEYLELSSSLVAGYSSVSLVFVGVQADLEVFQGDIGKYRFGSTI